MAEFSTSTVLWNREGFDGACARIADLGIRHVDVWQVKGWCEHLADGARAAERTLNRHDLKLSAISAFHADPKEMIELLSVLKDLDGSVLIAGSAKPDVGLAEFVESIRPVVERAAALGVTFAVENHGNACVDSTASIVELTEALPGPGLGIALAPPHLFRRGEDTVAAIHQLHNRIAFFYLWDWATSTETRDASSQFLGSGEIDYAPIIAAIEGAGLTIPLNLFAHGAEHWPGDKTRESLRNARDYAERLRTSVKGSAHG